MATTKVVDIETRPNPRPVPLDSRLNHDLAEVGKHEPFAVAERRHEFMMQRTPPAEWSAHADKVVLAGSNEHDV